MSQQKVDKYKQEKANRDKILKKQKRVLLLEKIAAGVVCLAVIGWIGYSAYGMATKSDSKEVVKTEIDATAVNDYLNQLSTQ